MLLASVMFISSCNKQPSLENTSWELIEMHGIPIDRSVLEDKESYTLNFNKEVAVIKATGKGDGNRFFAKCEFEGVNELEFEDMGSTKMMSPNQFMEDAYFEMLKDVESYSIKKGVLALKDDDGIISLFSRK